MYMYVLRGYNIFLLLLMLSIAMLSRVACDGSMFLQGNLTQFYTNLHYNVIMHLFAK
jgi:hypothetical protein